MIKVISRLFWTGLHLHIDTLFESSRAAVVGHIFGGTVYETMRVDTAVAITTAADTGIW